MLGGAHAINTVIDEERRLSLINFGEITASHRQAVEMVQQYCRVPVPRNFDLVITSGAGYPLDSTYYQTVKGMVGAAAILKPGGDLVIASQCSEGIGSPEYLDAQRRFTTLGAEGFLESLREKPFADIDEWQTQMQTRAMVAGNIFLFSELDASDRQLTGVKSIGDLDAFLQSLPDQLSIAVIPEGPYVVPYVDHELTEAGPCGA